MWLSFLAYACLARLYFCGRASIHTHELHLTASNRRLCDQLRQKERHAFHQCAVEERFDWGYRDCLDGGQYVYKCHYLAGTSAYCALRGWVLLAARRGEVGGMYQPVWWTTKWIEWRMWWREGERRRKEWLFREKPTHAHSQKEKLKFLVGRKINKRGYERWSSFPENSISSFYSSDNSSFLEDDEIAFWAILKQGNVLH